jgi:S1-C subfamily serine protease
MSRWFYTPDNKQRIGPLTTAQLRQHASKGFLRPEYMVMREGTGKWMPASTVKGLFPESGAARPSDRKEKAATRPPEKRSRRGPMVAVVGCLALLLVSCSGVALVGAYYSGWLKNSSPSLASAADTKKGIGDLTVKAPDEAKREKAPDKAEIQPESPQQRQPQPDPPQKNQPQPDPPELKPEPNREPKPEPPKAEPKTEPKTEPPKTEPKSEPEPDPARGQPSDKPLPAQIATAAVKHVKAATVLVDVVASDGSRGSGSGFFALKPGVVITNAHVLGMLGKQAGAPKSVDVVLYGATAKETKLKAAVVGVDRDNDLAVVRVDKAGLPAPLELELNRPLVETQKVYVFGFPFGVQLGKNITISESSVSSLRNNGTDSVQQIQVNGGIHPGNSGGPLVNTEGKVIGVAVSVIKGTQINFAIPAPFVGGLMTGRVTESWMGQPYLTGGNVSIPVKFTFLDPFAQVKELRVDVWAGMPGTAPSASLTEPKARPGDGKRQSATVSLNENVGELDVAVPELGQGQVCWIQPVFVNADNKTHWGPAVATVAPLMPVERNPVKLAANFAKVPERTVKLKSVSSVTMGSGKISEAATDKIDVSLLEVIDTNDKLPFIRISYGPTVDLASEVNGRPVKTHAETAKMFRALPPSYVVLLDGGLKSRVSRTLNPKLPIQLRADYLDVYEQFCDSMEAAMMPIPSRDLEPLAKYDATVALLVSGGPSISGGAGKGDRTEIAKTVDLKLRCTYQGKRTRNDREEAVVTFVGQVKGRSKGTEKAKGDVTGKYAVDIEGGFVSLVQIRVFTEIELPGGAGRLSFTLDVDADRGPGNPLKIPPPRK